MDDKEKLRRICSALRSKYGQPGRDAATLLRKWLSGKIRYANPEIIEKHLEEKHLPLIFDAFRQVVPFGTGGQRGPVGYGPNRINPANLAITVQGHCNYLRAANAERADLAVVVASDVRVFKDFAGRYTFLGANHPLIGVSSRSLGRLACEIYAGNGITAHFPPPDKYAGTMSTPEMAFHIRRLEAAGGIQLSASHNPPDDNGLKIYNEFGSQPIAPEDEKLAAFMGDVGEISMLDFDEALGKGLVQWTTEETHDEYIETYTRMYAPMPAPDPSLPIVYAPLNGCGLSSVGELLERLGFKFLVPPGEGPDGTFSAVPLRAPNPEVSQATGPAKQFADKNDIGVVLCSDPDVDRVGLDVRLANGDWQHFDGNQIATVLCKFLMLDANGPKRSGLVIKTFVTTRLLDEIATRTKSPIIDDLPVGMKYVANVLNELETKGHYGALTLAAEDLAFAAEESHGVMIAPLIRDKDAAPACMYLACLYQILRREGRTLLDYYVQALAELGAHETVNRSIVMIGADGTRDKDSIMAALRASPPTSFAGAKVREVVDFWDQEKFGPFKGYTDQLSRNAIQIITSGFVIVIRPSGTEPKLKVYCQLMPAHDGRPVHDIGSLRELKSAANRIADLGYNELLAIINKRLSQTALLLPDIVDLDQKIRFEREILPALRQLLTGEAPPPLTELLEWLRNEAAALVPGADPLPALKPAIAHQCLEWSKKDLRAPALRELAAWADEHRPEQRASAMGRDTTATDRRGPSRKARPAATETRSAAGGEAEFVVVSANYGGAARGIKSSRDLQDDRAKALGAFVLQAGGRDAGQLPVVAGIQEFTRFDAPDGAGHAEFMGLSRKDGDFYYVPTLSTDWYPQKNKWQLRWDEQVCRAEQGLAALALRGAVLTDPERNAPPSCGGATPFHGMVVNLPVVKFRKPTGVQNKLVSLRDNWIRLNVEIRGAEPYEVEFKHTRYLGDRDSEPRIATAHLVRVSDRAEFVFINLHLTTLRETAAAKDKVNTLEPGTRARAVRAPSREAEFLRHLQLSEIGDFIRGVYTDETLRLPVVVAGDFNTTPGRPDLEAFMADASLKPVFRADCCWACGGAPLTVARRVFGGDRLKTVLTENEGDYERLTGEAAQAVLATEYCSQCERPLFTHKGNFQLVDNILYTDGSPEGAALRARVEFVEPEVNAGIGADTYFSDHFPIWSRFRVTGQK